MTNYGVTAQFYDCMAADQHALADRLIADALRTIGPLSGPLVDIGAGTGLSTQLIATTLPGSRILAVEPDSCMRAALMTRIWSNVDLRSRVTIFGDSVFKAPLPNRISGAVFSASIVHFSPSERQTLWSILSERLAEDGRIIVEILAPTASDQPERLMTRARVGDLDYEGFASAERVDHERQRWRMTYRISQDCVETQRLQTEFVCWALSAEALLNETSAFGLTGEINGAIVSLRHSAFQSA